MKVQFNESASAGSTTQESVLAVVVEQKLADRWGVIIKKCEHSGLLYAAGFGSVK